MPNARVNIPYTEGYTGISTIDLDNVPASAGPLAPSSNVVTDASGFLTTGGGPGPGGSTLTTTFVNADAVPLVPGMPIANFGPGAIKRGNATSTALSRILGIVTVGAGLALPATVALRGLVTLTTAQWDAVSGQVGGLTAGALYFLDIVAGKISAAAPIALGQSVVLLGIATSPTDLDLDPQPAILL